MKFMLVNTDFDDYEIFTIGKFETFDEAFKYASELADKMGYDIEIYELKRVAQPSFGPSMDDQVVNAWGQALMDEGMVEFNDEQSTKSI